MTSAENSGLGLASFCGVLAIFIGFYGLLMLYRRLGVGARPRRGLLWPAKPPAQPAPTAESAPPLAEPAPAAPVVATPVVEAPAMTAPAEVATAEAAPVAEAPAPEAPAPAAPRAARTRTQPPAKARPRIVAQEPKELEAPDEPKELPAPAEPKELPPPT
jgi:hypothetical protein